MSTWSAFPCEAHTNVYLVRQILFMSRKQLWDSPHPRVYHRKLAPSDAMCWLSASISPQSRKHSFSKSLLPLSFSSFSFREKRPKTLFQSYYVSFHSMGLSKVCFLNLKLHRSSSHWLSISRPSILQMLCCPAGALPQGWLSWLPSYWPPQRYHIPTQTISCSRWNLMVIWWTDDFWLESSTHQDLKHPYFRLPPHS